VDHAVSGPVRTDPDLPSRNQQGVQEKNPQKFFEGYPQNYPQVAIACVWKTGAA
jgi:hypothetical protein